MSDSERTAQTVEIRDRRELPFFQVRLRALCQIRSQVDGPRRVRTVGFYALMCQIANEQRHTGQHRTVQITYEQLAHRSGAGRSSIRRLLEVLCAARVIDYSLVNDPARAAPVGVMQLLVHDGSWEAITVAMANEIARPRRGGHVLRDLGLVTILLEFCAEQRDHLGGLRAEITRGDIAARAGLTVDRVDDCNRILEQCGILDVSRRRSERGGRNLANVYEIHEAPSREIEGGEPGPAGRKTGTGRAEDWDRQGGGRGPAEPHARTARAENEDWQGGHSADLGPAAPPSTTCAGDGGQKDVENITPLFADVQREGEGPDSSSGIAEAQTAERLCAALVAAWRPALGQAADDAYAEDRERWHESARRLLEKHPPTRLQRAIAYMTTDDVLGSQALTMPGFAKVVNQLLARSYAREQRTRTAPATPRSGAALSWQEAKPLLERAVTRHGRDGRAVALTELSRHSSLLVRFVDQVRWTVLCEQPMRYVERQYAALWAQLADVDDHQQEPAA